MGDLTSRRWSVSKGVMFAAIMVMAGASVLIHEDVWFRLGLLLICLWAACRFYYFLFYVLERYIGVGDSEHLRGATPISRLAKDVQDALRLLRDEVAGTVVGWHGYAVIDQLVPRW